MRNHWNYFLALVEDFGKTMRYVDVHHNNYETYSIEFAKIIILSCQETDVIMKMLCRIIDPSLSCGGINAYYSIISNEYLEFKNEEVRIPYYQLILKPWENWTASLAPEWWTANNKIKHHRNSHFHLANLKMALNSLAALYILIGYSNKKIIEEKRGELIEFHETFRDLKPNKPKYFSLDNKFYHAW